MAQPPTHKPQPQPHLPCHRHQSQTEPRRPAKTRERPVPGPHRSHQHLDPSTTLVLNDTPRQSQLRQPAVQAQSRSEPTPRRQREGEGGDKADTRVFLVYLNTLRTRLHCNTHCANVLCLLHMHKRILLSRTAFPKQGFCKYLCSFGMHSFFLCYFPNDAIDTVASAVIACFT